MNFVFWKIIPDKLDIKGRFRIGQIDGYINVTAVHIRISVVIGVGFPDGERFTAVCAKKFAKAASFEVFGMLGRRLRILYPGQLRQKDNRLIRLALGGHGQDVVRFAAELFDANVERRAVHVEIVRKSRIAIRIELAAEYIFRYERFRLGGGRRSERFG
ncbi:hypothetical protein SDC9_202861 [bioreactor metagenome]|uniref:Uncharacterized protein n=1 Tax=bioreactor metagenome TaxID=1076179 RepID=A0A645IWD4_9ZZZZ